MAMERVRNKLDILIRRGIIIDSLVESRIWNYESIRTLFFLRYYQCDLDELKSIMAWTAFSMIFDQFNAPLELLSLMLCQLREPSKDTLIFRDMADDRTAIASSLQDTLNSVVLKEKDSLDRKLITYKLSGTIAFNVENTMMEAIVNFIEVIPNDNHITDVKKKTKLSTPRAQRFDDSRPLEQKYDIIIDDNMLQPKFIAYLGMLSLCSFRCILKSPAIVLKSLNRTFVEVLRQHYSEEFRANELTITLPSEECLAAYKVSMQEGSTGAKSAFGYCIHHLLSNNNTTSTLAIIRNGLLTHTSMAGLQLVSMLLLASNVLKFDDPLRLLSMLWCKESMNSIKKMLTYLQLYFTTYKDLNEIEIAEKRAVKATFKWAKLIDQRYFADISVKNNLYFGFMLASLNSNSIKEGQTQMAVFDSPMLPMELKERIFIDMRKRVSMNIINFSNCSLIREVRNQRDVINDAGELENDDSHRQNNPSQRNNQVISQVQNSVNLRNETIDVSALQHDPENQSIIDYFDNLSFDRLNS